MDRTIIHDIATQQRRALDFMLDALGLPHLRDEALRAARGHQLEEPVAGLLAENRALRMRVRSLEHELDPDEAEMDAHEREMDSRIAREAERRPDDI